MRHSGSELGYLAPARDFGRTASIVLVAGAVGATAAGGAVLALLGGPGSDSSLATPAVMRSVEPAVTRAAGPSAAKRTTASSAAPAQTARANASPLQEQALASSTPGSQPATGSSEPDSGSAAELAATPERAGGAHDAAGKAAATPAAAPPAEGAPAEKKVSKKPAFFSRYAWRGGFFRDSGRWGGGGFYRDRGWRRDVW
jgi:hypothetical protein